MLHLVAIDIVVGDAHGEPDIGQALRIGIGREEEFEAGGQDADDYGAARPAGGQALAQHVGLAAEAALPVVVGDEENGGDGGHGARCGAGRGRRLRNAIGVDEAAAQDGRGAHHGEEVGADGATVDQFRRAVLARHDVAEGLHGGDVLEDGFGAVAQIEEIGVGEREVLNVALAHVGEGEHQAVGILVGKRAQQNGIGHAEDGGGGADPERDGENGGGREDGALAQRAESVQQVTKQHASLQEFVSG